VPATPAACAHPNLYASVSSRRQVRSDGGCSLAQLVGRSARRPANISGQSQGVSATRCLDLDDGWRVDARFLRRCSEQPPSRRLAALRLSMRHQLRDGAHRGGSRHSRPGGRAHYVYPDHRLLLAVGLRRVRIAASPLHVWPRLPTLRSGWAFALDCRRPAAAYARVHLAPWR